MKTLYKISMMFFVLTIVSSCDDEDYKLDPQVVQMGALESPENDQVVTINTSSDDRITFSWSQAKTADGGAVTYRILFDEQGGDFKDPIFTAASDNGGGASTYTASAARLNVIAAQAGIQQLEIGSIDWTVEVTSSYLVNQFDTFSTVKLKRPEGLAIFPEYMYIYGSATEATSIENAIAFKEISSEMPNQDIQPGVFESITKLTSGEFFIANSDNVNADDMSYYYINEEGKIRGGEEPSSFDMEEGVYRVQMDLSKATISFTEISDIKLYIMANEMVKANLTYVGNHTFEATDGYFEFLTPGSPEAPSWLGWEEERYRFKFMLDDQVSYIGSFHNDNMDGSLVQGLDAFNGRPNGGEPDYYFNTYFLGTDATFWQGAWKFPDQLNKVDFTVRIVFDPKADHYYHEFQIN